VAVPAAPAPTGSTGAPSTPPAPVSSPATESEATNPPPPPPPKVPAPRAPATNAVVGNFSTAAPAATAQLAALASPSNATTPDLSGAGPDTNRGRTFEQADRVVVDKSDRKIYLYRRGSVVAEYPVKLGLNPYGHKQYEGDFRTPEGKYTLSRRNPRSDFFLAIQVSYPNREDEAWAKENGWRPGGLIMIHGQPNVPKRPAEFYATRDWTDGCIALSNSDMVDVWLRTSVGLPIEIRR
jgi:hypothetical protein